MIEVAGVVIRDEDGRILTVRKRGTDRFMFPGGKPEPGEDFRETAVRECAEELHLAVDPDGLAFVGTFTALAANEAGFDCREAVFDAGVPVGSPPAPHAEIAEVRWVDPAADLPGDLAPLQALIIPQLSA